MASGWMMAQVVSGKTVLNMLSYMQEFSIHMFCQQTTSSHLLETKQKYQEKSIRNQKFESWARLLTLLIIRLTGGLGNVTTVCYKKIISLVSSKWDQPSWNTRIRYSLSFTTSRLSIRSTRGVYSARGCVSHQVILLINLLSTEAKFQATINHCFVHFEQSF